MNALDGEDFSLIENRIVHLKHRGVFESLIKGSACKSNEPQPTLTFPCIDWLESCDFTGWNLIEIGSGNSTLYFSKRFKQVYSFETDRTWYMKMRGSMPNNVCYKMFDKNNPDTIKMDHLSNTLVLIDCNSNRFTVSDYLLQKQYNLYLLDNAESYPNTVELFYLKGYIEIPFFGPKHLGVYESCTSLFVKDLNLMPHKNKNFRHSLCKPYKQNLWDSIV